MHDPITGPQRPAQGAIPLTSPWHVEHQRSADGVTRWFVASAGKRASFADVLDLFERDEAFVDAWCAALAASPMPAYCWECPPFCLRSMHRVFECVLVASPSLDRAAPDPAPFAGYFADDRDVVAFTSLGGDATLVAPCPRDGRDFAHLARFLRCAAPSQRRALWREVGAAARRAAGQEPRWLSTAGLGVSWLHVRLDTRPKYYRHAAYRASPA
jgi:hypothetical protein